MGRKFSIIVSNLGKYSKIPSNSSDNNEWKIEDLIFSQSAVSFSTVIAINIISYEDILKFTIVDAVNHKKVERLGKGIVKCLKFFAKNENVTLQDFNLIIELIDLYTVLLV